MHYSIRLSVILVFLAILASACGAEKEKQVSVDGGERRGEPTRTLPPSVVPTITPTPEALAATTGLSGKLVFTSHENLYTWDFNSQADPTEVMTQVEPYNIYSLSETSFVFGAWDDLNHFSLYRYDLTTTESELLINFGRSNYYTDRIYWSINGVSPDAKWAIFSAYDFQYPMGLLALDGSEQVMKIASNYGEQYWTSDGNLIMLEYGEFTPEGIGDLKTVYWIEPATATQTDVSAQFDLAALNAHEDYYARREAFETQLTAQNIILAPEANIPDSSEDEDQFMTYIQAPEGMYRTTDSELEYCREWNIVKAETPTQSQIDAQTMPDPDILYTDPNAAILQSLMPMQDGSFIFLSVHYADCKYGSVTGELLRLQPDGSVDILAQGLASAADSDNALWGYLEQDRFILTQDKAHIFYLKFDDYGQTTTLYHLDLQTGENVALNMADTPIMEIGEFMMFP